MLKMYNTFCEKYRSNLLTLKAIASSLIPVLIILLLNYFYPDNCVLQKLVQGEVLAGLMVVFPTLMTWINTESANRINLYREEFKNLIEKINSKTIQISNLEVEELKDLLNKSDSKLFINYKATFLLLQNRLQIENITKSNFYFLKDIKDINSKLLKGINSEDLKDLMKKIDEFKFIDFGELFNNNLLLDVSQYKSKISFINCDFTVSYFKASDLLQNSSLNIKFENCILEKEILPLLKDFNLEYDVESIYYYDDIDELRNYTVEKKDGFKIWKKFEGLTDNFEEIFEERELLEYGPINQYILKNNVFDITLETNTNESINLKIIREIKKILGKGFTDISDDDIFVSRSKSYIQDSKNADNYKWRSWNALSSKYTNEEAKKLFIFAIQKENYNKNNFMCVIFDSDNMKALLNLKQLSSDGRYYFYLACKR